MVMEYAWKKIPYVVEQFRKENAIELYMIIKDDIFRLLNKYCIVIYYPLEDESNWGFRTRRFVNGKLADFVYINTARTLSEQIFIAAHELGHVWGVKEKLVKYLPAGQNLTDEQEELIVNRFAAELLMPDQRFRGSFMEYALAFGLNKKIIKMEDLVRVMVLLMRDYMVPYEAVRRRLVETGLLTERAGNSLKEDNLKIQNLVKAFLNDQNIFIDRPTKKKAVPGLRELIEKIEEESLLDVYTISKIKNDFDLSEVSSLNDMVHISDGDE